MKNLFKSLVMGALLLAVSSASAGTLYWQVSGAAQEFDEAWLAIEDRSTHEVTYLQGVDSKSDDKTSTVMTQYDISQYEGDGYLFYVEMSNYANGNYTKVADGYKYSYYDLVSSGYVAANPLEVASAQAAASQANFGSPIPEPSSGLLLLIGGAMLALRRRRQK